MDDWRTPEGDIDPQRIGHGIEELGKRWAELTHAAHLLEKTRDATLAQLILGNLEASPGQSMRRAELAAKASDDWSNHIYAIADARLKANLAKIEYDAACATFEAMRTAEATRRAEMQTLGKR